MKKFLILKFALLPIACFLLAGCAIFGGPHTPKIPPKDVNFYIQEGDTYLNENNLNMAVDSYSNALKKDPKSIETRRKLAESYTKLGNNDLALQEFSNIIQIEPNYNLAYNYRGFIYSSQSKWNEAIQDFESALKIEPNNLYTLAHLGLAYKMVGRIDDAKNTLQKASELDPNLDDPESKNVHNYLGLVYKDEGSLDEALAEYSKTLEHFTDDTKARNRIGEIYEAQEKYFEAADEYNQTLKISPDDSFAKSRIEALQQAGISTYYVKPVEIVKDDVEQYFANAPDASEYPDAGAIMLLSKFSYELSEKGLMRYTLHWIVKILNERGIAEFGEISVPFNSAYQNIGVNVARTILPDGTEIKAAEDAYHDITLPGVAEYNMYSNIMLKIVNMPALVPGAIIEYKATIEDAQETGEKAWIWGGMDFQALEPVLNAKCVLRVPKDKKVNWKQNNCQIEPVVTEDEKNTTYIWISKDNPRILLENSMPPLEEVTPSIFFTSDESWDEVYKWYKEIADPAEETDANEIFNIGLEFQPELDSGAISDSLRDAFSAKDFELSQDATVSLEEKDTKWRINDDKKIYSIEKSENVLVVYEEIIEQKIQELIAGKNTEEEKIKAIYEFAASDIRYVAIELGMGAYAPTPAIDVFLYKYGDCKDKTTLLIAMLRHIGVEAYQVLLSPAPGKTVNLALPSVAQFSHVITAIPLGDGNYIWLDPTASTCKYGDLPAGDQGRKVFVIGKEFGEFVDTPVHPSEMNKIHSSSEITLMDDGTIKGWEKTTAYGQADMYLKSVYRLMRTDERKKLLEDILNQRYPGVELSDVSISDISNLDIPTEVKVEFSCPEYVSAFDGTIAFPLPSEDFSSYAGLVGGKTERRYDFHLGYNIAVEKDLTLSIPKGYKIASLPKDVTVNHDFGTFSRKYERVNNTTVKYYTSLNFNTHIISLSNYAELKSLFETAAREDRAQIILMKQ
jgi:tetratricopeptide (TPR) repeat protein